MVPAELKSVCFGLFWVLTPFNESHRPSCWHKMYKPNFAYYVEILSGFLGLVLGQLEKSKQKPPVGLFLTSEMTQQMQCCCQGISKDEVGFVGTPPLGSVLWVSCPRKSSAGRCRLLFHWPSEVNGKVLWVVRALQSTHPTETPQSSLENTPRWTSHIKAPVGWGWWSTPRTLAFGRWRQGDQEFKVSFGFTKAK